MASTYLKRFRLWYKDAELITWSRLAVYGNNPLVKTAILAPLLAQILIHQDTAEFLQRYDFTNLEWLYVSLMCFFVAQLVYSFLCDRDIKDYPSEVKFIQVMEAITPDEDLIREYFDVYKIYFKKYGGVIDQDKYDLAEARHHPITEDMKVERHLGIDPPTARNDEARESIDNIMLSIRHRQQFGEIDWRLLTSLSNSSLRKMFQTEKFEENSYRTSNETTALLEMIGKARAEFGSSHWRAKAIKRRYLKLNNKYLTVRRIAAALYGLGTLYFLWTGASNIYKVLEQYGWVA